MRRKQQIQAMQQELALLRQTIDSGKELAALATNNAQQPKKPSPKTVAEQPQRHPPLRRHAPRRARAGCRSSGSAPGRERSTSAVARQARFIQMLRNSSSLCEASSRLVKPPHFACPMTMMWPMCRWRTAYSSAALTPW